MFCINVIDQRRFFKTFNKYNISSQGSSVVVDDGVDEKVIVHDKRYSAFVKTNRVSKFVNDSVNYKSSINPCMQNGNVIKTFPPASMMIKPQMSTNYIVDNVSLAVNTPRDVIVSRSKKMSTVSLFVDSSYLIEKAESNLADMNIKCQIGMYFELISKSLNGATVLENLPDGLNLYNGKICGTPTCGGKFTSKIITSTGKVFTIIFEISKLQRLL